MADIDLVDREALAGIFEKATAIRLFDNGSHFYLDVGSQISEQARLAIITALRTPSPGLNREAAQIASDEAFRARQAIRSARGPKDRQRAIGAEEAAQAIQQAILALPSARSAGTDEPPATATVADRPGETIEPERGSSDSLRYGRKMTRDGRGSSPLPAVERSTLALPEIPDDDSDFTPELARKICARYQQIIAALAGNAQGADQSSPAPAPIIAGCRANEYLDGILNGNIEPCRENIITLLAWLKSTSLAGNAVETVDAERSLIAEKTRLYASYYPMGSDGRNTFIVLAEWIEGRMIRSGIAALSQPAPKIGTGWKLVPIEPTREMRGAYHDARDRLETSEVAGAPEPDYQWKAMLDASPLPATQREGE